MTQEGGKFVALSRLKALVASQAVKKFTDRENARDAFDNNLQAYLAGEITFKILTYYGIGGIGKTSLLKELKKTAKDRSEVEQWDLSLVNLDFDSDHISSAAEALYAFRVQWPGDSPLFDFALAKYWVIQGRTIDQIRKQVIREDSLLFDLLEAGASFADVFVPAKLVKKLFSKGSDFLRRHGHLANRFEHIESLTEAEVAEWLPVLLGEEIERWVITTNKHMLVFIDGYEQLLTNGQFKLGKLCAGVWLQELLGSAKKGLFVICGRNYLDWGDHNSEWKAYLEQHRLGMLANEDADTFLLGIPVIEDEVRKAIINSSHGVPLYLDLCASIYVLKKQAGEAINEEDFQGAEGHVIDRFLSNLDREQAEAVRALSCLDGFDKRTFAAITKALNIGLPITLFDEFCSASYAEFVPSFSNFAKIHNIVCEYLRLSIRSDDLERIVLAVVTELQASKDEADYLRVSWLLRSLLPAFTLSSLHIGTGTQSKIVMWCLEMADAGYVDVAMTIGNELAAHANSSGIAVMGDIIQAHCFRRRGRLEDAKLLYVTIRNEMIGDILPEIRMRVKYQAAHVDHLLGEYASAKIEYASVVSTNEPQPTDQESRYLAKRQLGDISMLEGKFLEALQVFSECENLQQSDKLWSLECKRFVGHVYRFNWMLSEAESRYADIAKQSKAFNLLGMQGKALVNLSETYWWDHPDKAIDVGNKAMEVNENCGNVIEIGKALTAIALAELNLGHVTNAIEYLDRAEKVQRSAGYRAGLIFIEGARAFCYFVSSQDDGMSASLCRADQLSEDIGVYKFLSCFYRAVCTVDDVHNAVGVYEWLNEPFLMGRIKSLSVRFSQLRKAN